MFRDMLSGSRAIPCRTCFLFIGCRRQPALYSWHAHRTTDAELARTDAVLQHVNRNETRAAEDTTDTSTVDFQQTGTDLETDETQPIDDNPDVSPIDETSEALDLSDAFLPDDFVSGEESAEGEDVPVSPFGFGPYPEIPDGFPFDNPWDVPTTNAAFELMHRVQIKLWNEGKHPEGMAWENGRVYPIYPNTIYVTWDYVENDDGTIERYPSQVTSGTLSSSDEALLDEGIVPSGVIVYDHNESGIDPYSYLNLK